ncbi:hypothetical protein E2C01_078979 [Portunus trituberculatus]|uniref:Uncharacterized protein n=1 Tax=Portunus trituberculatus TaxID=210409 RepID=A0A5B7IUC2_PORTR|nr:hypothetical protein [Portunus trituberculatus]
MSPPTGPMKTVTSTTGAMMAFHTLSTAQQAPTGARVPKCVTGPQMLTLPTATCLPTLLNPNTTAALLPRPSTFLLRKPPLSKSTNRLMRSLFQNPRKKSLRQREPKSLL